MRTKNPARWSKIHHSNSSTHSKHKKLQRLIIEKLKKGESRVFSFPLNQIQGRGKFQKMKSKLTFTSSRQHNTV